MLALCYNEPAGQLQLRRDHPLPLLKEGEAVCKVVLAGICSTDLEIIKGYVPGYNSVLGHEFVGRVEMCTSRPELVGKRVVGEINCNDAGYTCSDCVFQRNHAPNRSVMGIINRDGCMATHVSLPVSNLHVVPEELTDTEAAFAEPLAAACRILEQGLLLSQPTMDVAVIGDGKLGLLVAQLLAAEGARVIMFGRHASKMQLVQGLQEMVILSESEVEDPVAKFEGRFQLVIEASGSSHGVLNALRLTRPMGTLLLKSTVSVKDGGVQWAQVANDVVVNEKTLLGSRCGPMDVALNIMVKHASVRQLLTAMVTKVFPLAEAEAAVAMAQTRGVLKVQLAC